MSAITWLSGGSNSGTVAPIKGEHNLQETDIFRQSLPDAVTPNNCPNGVWDVYRKLPAHNQTKAFKPEDVQFLEQSLDEVKEEKRATRKVARLHEKILNETAQVNRWNQYMFRNENQFELRVQGYKKTTAKSLQRTRPKYAALGTGYQQTVNWADQAIASVETMLSQPLTVEAVTVR